jgi:transcriptional regulator with XRE-family HTH domain
MASGASLPGRPFATTLGGSDPADDREVEMPVRQGPTVRRRRLGAELRRLREEADLTIERVAKALECSDSKISRIETGQVSASPRDVRDMLALYGVGSEQREALVQIAREARQLGWWHTYGDVPVVPAYIALEEAAASIETYEALLVPSLFQDVGYARAVVRAVRPDLAPEEVERRVALRMARQEALRGRADPPALRVVLDEAVLRRPVGGREVMRQQLRQLGRAAALPNVTLQVLPFPRGEHAGMDGAFTILSFPGQAEPDVVVLDSTTSDLYLEGKEELRRYRRVFELLRAAALTPEESRAFLAALQREP